MSKPPEDQRVAEARERLEALSSRSPGAFSRLLARQGFSELRSDLRLLLSELDRVTGERDEARTLLRDALAARNVALADADEEGARALAAEADRDRMRKVAKVLAVEAVLLLNNAEGCVRNHTAETHYANPEMPPWLRDSRERITTARAALTQEDDHGR